MITARRGSVISVAAIEASLSLSSGKQRAEETQSARVTGEPAEKLLREMRAKYS